MRLKIKLLAITIFKFFFPHSTTLNQVSNKIKSAIDREKWYEKFKKISTKKYGNFFYFLSPIPKISELNEFYSTDYQNARDVIPFEITPRELTQISFLKKKFKFENKKILNFGCGKSGFSYLCKLMGANVVEVDAKNKKETNFDKDIYFTNSIENLKGSKFDLIYASHSLEHVSNIRETLASFETLSKEDTHFFFEVPDGEIDLKLRKQRGRIFPHIFFFRKDFYKNIFSGGKDKDNGFFNIFDNDNLEEYSSTSVKDNIIVWTNKNLNLEEIKRISI